MSLADDLLEKVFRRAGAMSTDVREELIRGYNKLQKSIGLPALEEVIRAGAFDEVFTEDQVAAAFAGMTQAIEKGLTNAGVTFTKDIPDGGVFDKLSPAVEEAIATLNDRALQTLDESIRDGVRTTIENGIRDGLNPRDIAVELRDQIGLAPNQVDAVANFRGLLETGDPDALNRELRDARFDSTVQKAIDGEKELTPAQIDKMVNAYEKNMIAFNAETNARTIALDAQKMGNHIAWADAVERGAVDGENLTKRWSGTLDDREREEHLAMEGETVKWDEPFSNGEMVPGESTFNCRCVAIYEPNGEVQPGEGAQEQTKAELADAANLDAMLADSVLREEARLPPVLNPDGTPETRAQGKARRARARRAARKAANAAGGNVPVPTKPGQFVPATTTRGVDEFAVRVLGMKSNAGRKLPDTHVWVGNKINQELFELKKQGYFMPNEIHYSLPTRLQSHIASMDSHGILEINLQNRAWMTEEMNRRVMQELVDTNWLARVDTVTHELGHWLHFQNLPIDYDATLAKFVRGVTKITIDGKLSPRFEIAKDWKAGEFERFIGPKLTDSIRTYVSRYASTIPLEFIAEAFTILNAGGKLPDELMLLYKELKGPTVIK